MNALLLTFVSNPDRAVLLLLGGILLLYAEFNKPGTVISGCLGALALMYALYGLDHVPLRPFAAGLALAGVASIVMGCWFPQRSIRSIASSIGGTAALIFGLLRLVARPPVHPAVAIAAALVFSAVTTVLVRIAVLARRNKRSSAPQNASPALQRGFSRVQPEIAAAGPRNARRVD